MMFRPLPSRVDAIAALLLGSLAWASNLPFDFQHHGNFQRMMHTGNTPGQVTLAALPQHVGTWGVGATDGLKGEIVQIDGKLLSPGTGPSGRAPQCPP
jgi:hypothetical protein